MHVMSIRIAKEFITGNSKEMSALCPVRIKDARERTRAHTHNTHKYTHTHTQTHSGDWHANADRLSLDTLAGCLSPSKGGYAVLDLLGELRTWIPTAAAPVGICALTARKR